jgi:hypothetical protein
MTTRGAVFFRHQAPDVSVVPEGDEHDDLRRGMALGTRLFLSIVRLFTWYCVEAAFLFTNSHTVCLDCLISARSLGTIGAYPRRPTSISEAPRHPSEQL